MKSSLKRNLLIGFGVSLLVLVGSSVASWVSVHNLLASATLVKHTNEVVQKLQETMSFMKDAETGERGFLVTGKDQYLDPYTGSADKVKILIGDIRQLTADNPDQQQPLQKLEERINRRFWNWQDMIGKKRMTDIVTLSDMQQGKNSMDSIRVVVADMIAREQTILQTRTASRNSFASITPPLIIAGALLAILITVIFYVNMNRDIADRTRLQEELIDKDAGISRRIRVIQSISEKISTGDYGVRVTDSETDELGNISGALNKMAASLETSFKALSDRQWLQAGMAGLNETIIGDDNLQVLAQKLMSFIAAYSNSQAGAFYVLEMDGLLTLETGYALSSDHGRNTIKTGEGLAGQCAVEKKLLVLENTGENDLSIDCTAAKIKPVCIAAFPLIFNKDVKGVIELASLHTYTDNERAFFSGIADSIGIAINTLQNRRRVQELLEETQSQAGELMSQQSELEQINAELEAQAQRLQTSEEELKVQSEELTETNTILEEKSLALEQRNQLIQQKNAEIEKRSEDLLQSTRYKSEFLANMSHELRTPLNSILLLSRLLAENHGENLTADQVQYANVILGSGNGLLQLIDEILDLSKIESGKMTVEWLIVPVSEILDGIKALFKPVAQQKQLEWTITTGEAVPAEIETDRLRLEQVLKNLLSNAFKFTTSGHVRLLVSQPIGKPGIVQFVVTDSGIGISYDKQELIFEAFRQEDGSTRRKFGGTGLGLSISRELARLLGGEITLSSTAGKGSEFTFSLPITRGGLIQPPFSTLLPEKLLPEPAAANKYDITIIPEELPDDRDNLNTGDKKILIIEDDTKFAVALLDYARQKGYKGLVAVRGDKGIEMAGTYEPTAILLDLQLPVKNGWQVMAALKSNPRTRHIPVHIMSSYEVRKESLMTGAVEFINKPVAFEQLATIFEKLEFILTKKEKKVLIIEENDKHAKALAFYLEANNVHTEIFQTVAGSVQSLYKKETDCVILDMSIADGQADELLQRIRQNEGLEELPIILFTGKSLTQPDEFRLKKYADAIVMKTAHSYQRILDEVSLFLHLVQEQQDKQAGHGFEKSILQENVLKNKKVLLADDDVRNIFSMTRVLEKYQMQVIPAMDGREALQHLRTTKADVVLMDMMMPNLDGYDTIRAIRSNPQYKNLPIIAVTAKAMSGDREKCIAAGASDYISKPVDMDQLISLLRIWLYEKGY